jgi:hypothetical protein
VFQAPRFLSSSVRTLVSNVFSSSLPQVVQQTLVPPSSSLDALAQTFSRIDVILVIAMCVIGFLISFRKGRLTHIDKAVFLSGMLYLIAGVFIPILGQRVLALVFVPVSLGIYSLVKWKRGLILKLLVLFSVALFVFVPLHYSLSQSEVQFQTKEAHVAENFLINYGDWASLPTKTLLVQFRPLAYLRVKIVTDLFFMADSPTGHTNLTNADIILYTVGLGRSLSNQGQNINDLIEAQSFNGVYTNGYSALLVRNLD